MRHLSFANARITFRGSFATGTYDEFSDIDLLVEISGCELAEDFFSDLEGALIALYGPALVRYDPDNADTTDFQHVRFSFYRLPVYWRVDLDISSDRRAAEKHPILLPEWQTGTSALMNVVWAVKYHKRKKEKTADQYLHSACEKLDCENLAYSAANARRILSILENRRDADKDLLEKVRVECV